MHGHLSISVTLFHFPWHFGLKVERHLVIWLSTPWPLQRPPRLSLWASAGQSAHIFCPAKKIQFSRSRLMHFRLAKRFILGLKNPRFIWCIKTCSQVSRCIKEVIFKWRKIAEKKFGYWKSFAFINGVKFSGQLRLVTNLLKVHFRCVWSKKSKSATGKTKKWPYQEKSLFCYSINRAINLKAFFLPLVIFQKSLS